MTTENKPSTTNIPASTPAEQTGTSIPPAATPQPYERPEATSLPTQADSVWKGFDE